MPISQFRTVQGVDLAKMSTAIPSEQVYIHTVATRDTPDIDAAALRVAQLHERVSRIAHLTPETLLEGKLATIRERLATMRRAEWSRIQAHGTTRDVLRYGVRVACGVACLVALRLSCLAYRWHLRLVEAANVPAPHQAISDEGGSAGDDRG